MVKGKQGTWTVINIHTAFFFFSFFYWGWAGCWKAEHSIAGLHNEPLKRVRPCGWSRMKVPEPGARRDSSGCIAGALNPFSKASVISSGRRKSGRQEKDETETARTVRKQCRRMASIPGADVRSMGTHQGSATQGAFPLSAGAPLTLAALSAHIICLLFLGFVFFVFFCYLILYIDSKNAIKTVNLYLSNQNCFWNCWSIMYEKRSQVKP